MSGWSWEEWFDARQRTELARRIVAEPDKRLPATTGRRLYAATGHPTLSRHLERALDSARTEGELRKVARPGLSAALVTSDPDLFARILPTVFWFGRRRSRPWPSSQARVPRRTRWGSWSGTS